MEERQPDEIFKSLSEDLTLLESAERREQLEDYLNFLLLNDFNALVHLLYRVDVNEMQLKELLAQNKEEKAAVLIADLLIKRMAEKKASRELLRNEDEIPEEDKW